MQRAVQIKGSVKLPAYSRRAVANVTAIILINEEQRVRLHHACMYAWSHACNTVQTDTRINHTERQRHGLLLTSTVGVMPGTRH